MKTFEQVWRRENTTVPKNSDGKVTGPRKTTGKTLKVWVRDQFKTGFSGVSEPVASGARYWGFQKGLFL